MTLFGRERLEEAASAALKSPADGVLVIVEHDRAGLTRYANSTIHQNVWREDVEVRVVAALGDRVGMATGSSLDAEGVCAVADDAVSLARVTPPNPDWGGFAPPAEYAPAETYDEATASATPARRAAIIERALARFPQGMHGAGYVETFESEIFIGSTTGLRAYATGTRAGFSCLATAGGSSGFAEGVARRLPDLDADAMVERAVRKAELSRDPIEVGPGRTTVVLEPAAVSNLLEYLAFTALGSKAFLEGRSHFSGRIGQRICSDLITILDDPLAPDMLGLPFDAEGTPAGRRALIEHGVALDVAWDRSSARKARRESTGNALSPLSTWGAFPTNVRMLAGDEPFASIVETTERGLLVTRFHYTNVVNEKETLLTGMTRDGTFLIEDGKVSGPVRNLRFTQSAVEALSNVEAVGAETELMSDFGDGSGARAPALRIHDFNFSSTTTH